MICVLEMLDILCNGVYIFPDYKYLHLKIIAVKCYSVSN